MPHRINVERSVIQGCTPFHPGGQHLPGGDQPSVERLSSLCPLPRKVRDEAVQLRREGLRVPAGPTLSGNLPEQWREGVEASQGIDSKGKNYDLTTTLPGEEAVEPGENDLRVIGQFGLGDEGLREGDNPGGRKGLRIRE